MLLRFSMIKKCLRSGMILHKKVGDFVQENDCMATVYANNQEKAEISATQLKNIFKLA